MVTRTERLGRPPLLLDEELRGRILGGLENGASLRAAAAAVGVDYSSLKNWRKRGREEPGSIYAEFLAQSETAREAGKHGLLQRIFRAESWQAQAWLLERIWPQEFAQAKRERDDRSNEERGAIIVVNNGDEKDKLIARLERRLAALESKVETPNTG